MLGTITSDYSLATTYKRNSEKVQLTVLFCKFLTLHSRMTGCPTKPVTLSGVLGSKYGAPGVCGQSSRNSVLNRLDDSDTVLWSRGRLLPLSCRHTENSDHVSNEDNKINDGYFGTNICDTIEHRQKPTMHFQTIAIKSLITELIILFRLSGTTSLW